MVADDRLRILNIVIFTDEQNTKHNRVDGRERRVHGAPLTPPYVRVAYTAVRK